MIYEGPERRQFDRVGYRAPLAYKVCKEETITKLLQGYTADISESGLRCNIKNRVNKDDIVWLSFDRSTLDILAQLEKRSLIYQNGVVGKVVRIDEKGDDTFDIGVQFVTREEKNSTNIYPGFHFLEEKFKDKENSNG